MAQETPPDGGGPASQGSCDLGPGCRGTSRQGSRTLTWPYAAISLLLQLWGSALPCWGSLCWTLGTEAGTQRGSARGLPLPLPGFQALALCTRGPRRGKKAEIAAQGRRRQLCTWGPAQGLGTPLRPNLAASEEEKGSKSVGASLVHRLFRKTERNKYTNPFLKKKKKVF